MLPHPDGAGEVLQAQHHADEAIASSRIVRRAQLEHHLLLGAELQLLDVAAAAQIPDVQGVAVLASEQQLRIDAAAHHVRRPPLAGDHDVVAEMPPEIVGEILRAPVQLPAPARLEGLVVEDEDAAGAVAILSA